MKLLFDQNLSFKLVQSVADAFPGSSQVGLLGLAEADDRDVWNHAKAYGFAIVSQDADFAELAALLGPPPKSDLVARREPTDLRHCHIALASCRIDNRIRK